MNKNKTKSQHKYKHISLKEIESLTETRNLELTGFLSPLIGQEVVSFNGSKILLSHFRISEGKQYYPLLIWGALPHEIFEHRYQVVKVRVSGVKKEFFNNKIQLVLQKRGVIRMIEYQQFKQTRISFEDQSLKITIE